MAKKRTHKSEQSKADLYNFPGGTADSRATARHMMKRDREIFGGPERDSDMEDWYITKVEDRADDPDGSFLDY